MCSSNPMRLWSLDDENAKYNTAGWNPSAKPYNRTIAVLRVRRSTSASVCSTTSSPACVISLWLSPLSLSLSACRTRRRATRSWGSRMWCWAVIRTTTT
jgi:hypothetical protein